MTEVTRFILDVGYPISLVFLIIYGIYKLAKPLLDKFLAVLDLITETNRTLVATNSVLADKLDKKMDKVLEEVKGNK